MDRQHGHTVKNMRILLVYANVPMEPLMPLSLAVLSAVLCRAGFTVKIFDNTLYKDLGEGKKEREESMQVMPADYGSVGVKVINRDVQQDFKNIVDEFKPGFIGFYCVEVTFHAVLRLLEAIPHYDCPVIVGGSFASFSPEFVLAYDAIDMVCVGDGEKAVCDLAARLAENKEPAGIANIWCKKDGRLIPPSRLELTDIRDVPKPDFSLFPPERIYRPMSGKFYRMLPLEFSRGCVYNCPYCTAPYYAELFKSAGKWLRFKPVDLIVEEVEYYISEYNVEYLYCIAETFLAMPKAYKKEFYKKFKKFNIPFWFNTRPETINEEDIKACADIGCHRMSIGLECGNEDYRYRVLKRKYSNEEFCKAVEIVARSPIEFSINNVIGFPDETREMIFETIEVNRNAPANNHTASIFQPFKGTGLYRLCVEKGYWDPEKLCSGNYYTPQMNMPQLSVDEIKGLHRTFALYVGFDKDRWPEIARAEKRDAEGDRIFKKLSREYESKLTGVDPG